MRNFQIWCKDQSLIIVKADKITFTNSFVCIIKDDSVICIIEKDNVSKILPDLERIKPFKMDVKI